MLAEEESPLILLYDHHNNFDISIAAIVYVIQGILAPGHAGRVSASCLALPLIVKVRGITFHWGNVAELHGVDDLQKVA
ncbi:hypothetical protein DQ04_24691000 [Trypanosoma grayi]|uniref:hypothetical protein n=1 Tax=Trypanosoma grayi TaxID=71804 RepID=UPI0004F4672B|nr:hypothetical protein DQ04_24691000 [Trypanosoma grayi]KEG05248.1 hypothetical protein DQ04_24691000 [Trypanosoma grayi]